MTGQKAVPPQANPERPARPLRGLLFLAAALAIAWSAILIGIAWLWANPITLNRDQILRADVVITGRIESDPAAGEVSVSRDWTRNSLGGTIHVENLGDARVRKGETYVLPLSHATTGYSITEARLDHGDLLVYPAVSEATSQLEKILADRGAATEQGPAADRAPAVDREPAK